MRLIRSSGMMMLGLLVFSGCGGTRIVAERGKVIGHLTKPIVGAEVAMPGKDGKDVVGMMDIPAGTAFMLIAEVVPLPPKAPPVAPAASSAPK